MMSEVYSGIIKTSFGFCVGGFRIDNKDFGYDIVQASTLIVEKGDQQDDSKCRSNRVIEQDGVYKGLQITGLVALIIDRLQSHEAHPEGR
jgi:hypothetical protein